MDAIDIEIEESKQETYAKAKVEWAFLSSPIATRHETRTGVNRSDLIHTPGKVPVPTEWTVVVWQRVHNPSSKDWAVQGFERHLTGLVSQLRSYPTLARARDEAERLYATLTGSLHVERWPARAGG
jgi:hypothetical protein